MLCIARHRYVVSLRFVVTINSGFLFILFSKLFFSRSYTPRYFNKILGGHFLNSGDAIFSVRSASLSSWLHGGVLTFAFHIVRRLQKWKVQLQILFSPQQIIVRLYSGCQVVCVCSMLVRWSVWIYMSVYVNYQNFGRLHYHLSRRVDCSASLTTRTHAHTHNWETENYLPQTLCELNSIIVVSSFTSRRGKRNFRTLLTWCQEDKDAISTG